MDISFNLKLVKKYHSNSQIARVLTEDWTSKFMYCPICGYETLSKFPNNKKVADFYCEHCKSEFEQKSSSKSFKNKIVSGSYDAFIERICSNNNPNFLLMNYSITSMKVTDLIFIPKHFFIPEIIEKRKPLSANAKRAGWVGCNILLNKIPDQCKIYIIKNEEIIDKATVMQQVKWTQKIKETNLSTRSWFIDILNCINTINSDTFTLHMLYAFEEILSINHPQNNNIRAKIRQILQQLRDRNIIEFLGNGHYKKI